MRREAEFQTLFRHWLKAHQIRFASAAFELKQTTENSIPFSAVAEHQEAALAAVREYETGLLYKIPDDSRGIKPFDMVYLRRADAWIVIRFPDFFCLIQYEKFIAERNESKRKSLTAERARWISTHCVEIGQKGITR